MEEKLPDRTHLSERGQPEKKGGGGDQKKVLSGNEMDVQGGNYDFLFKVIKMIVLAVPLNFNMI